MTDESDEWSMMKESWSSLKICLDRNVTIEGNAVRHLMLVASHAESPLGDSKWLERKNCGGESLPLGRRYGFSYYSTSTTNTIFHFSIIHYELCIVNYKFQSSSPMKNRLTLQLANEQTVICLSNGSSKYVRIPTITKFQLLFQFLNGKGKVASSNIGL